MEAIPTIVCDTLYAMGLHDQVSLTNAVFTLHFLIPTNQQYSEPVDDKERWRICSSPLRVDALQANKLFSYPEKMNLANVAVVVSLPVL